MSLGPATTPPLETQSLSPKNCGPSHSGIPGWGRWGLGSSQDWLKGLGSSSRAPVGSGGSVSCKTSEAWYSIVFFCLCAQLVLSLFSSLSPGGSGLIVCDVLAKVIMGSQDIPF